MAKNRIAFDTNIWISFTIGKRLASLQNILKSKTYEIFYCRELIEEYYSVVSRKKFAKYITEPRISETIQLMESCAFVELETFGIMYQIHDPKDAYLLTLCDTAKLDYLITGDQDLLRMKNFNATVIVTFNQFNILKKRSA